MGTDQIMYCIVALLLGMLLANMLKNVCGCKNVAGYEGRYSHNSCCLTKDPNLPASDRVSQFCKGLNGNPDAGITDCKKNADSCKVGTGAQCDDINAELFENLPPVKGSKK